MNQRSTKPLAGSLRDLMSARGISDGIELSGIADVSAATVSLYLNGKRGRRMNSQAVATVEKLAHALGVAPEYFREYRGWQVREIARQAPELVDRIYDLLIEDARLRGLVIPGDVRTDDGE